MYLYFDKNLNLRTKIPHGEPIRQNNTLRLFVLLDQDNTTVEGFNLKTEIILPNRVSSGAISKKEYVPDETFRKINDNETTFDLVNGKKYKTYKFEIAPELSTVLAGKITVVLKFEKERSLEGGGVEIVETKTTSAELFVEKTYGNTGSTITRSEYESLSSKLESLLEATKGIKLTYSKEELDVKFDHTNMNVTQNSQDIQSVEERVGANEDDIAVLKANDEESDAEIEELKSRVSINESNIADLFGRDGQNASDILDLEHRITENENDISALSEKASEVDASIESTNGRVYANEVEISDLDERVNTLETNVIDIEDDIVDTKSDIYNIHSLIPNQASSDNKLADRNFVNSSINSMSAFPIEKDVDGASFETVQELITATTYYSGGEVRTPTRNDYAVVRSDEYHDHATTRYYYNEGWRFNYVVNETALTSDQLAALNSNITSQLVNKIRENESDIQELADICDRLQVGASKIVDVGSYQTSAYEKIFPAIKKAKAKEIYETYANGTPVITRWNVMGILPIEATVIGSDNIGGKYTFDIIVHNEYLCEYSYTSAIADTDFAEVKIIQLGVETTYTAGEGISISESGVISVSYPNGDEETY